MKGFPRVENNIPIPPVETNNLYGFAHKVRKLNIGESIVYHHPNYGYNIARRLGFKIQIHKLGINQFNYIRTA